MMLLMISSILMIFRWLYRPVFCLLEMIRFELWNGKQLEALSEWGLGIKRLIEHYKPVLSDGDVQLRFIDPSTKKICIIDFDNGYKDQFMKTLWYATEDDNFTSLFDNFDNSEDKDDGHDDKDGDEQSITPPNSIDNIGGCMAV